MRYNVYHRFAAIMAGTLPLFLPQMTLAQEVTLTSSDGLFTATGELVSFDNDIYIIGTTLGNMQIAASDVTCEGAACPVIQVVTSTVEADVRFAGSDTVGDGLMPLLLAGYGASYNALVEAIPTTDSSTAVELIGDEGYGNSIGVFQVDASTSTSAFTELLEKTAEFGMASRRIKREEARALAQAGAGSMIALEQEHIIAVDSLVVIVNPSNPVRSISIKDLGNIYRGNIRNWAELGGPDMPIVAYSRSQRTGTRSSFDSGVYGNGDVVQVARIAGTNTSMSATVSSNPGAIGFVGYAFVNDAQPVSLISVCGIETAANAFSAKTEEYPMMRRLYLYNREDNTTDAGQQFLQYALSSAADGVIDKAGYIDLGVQRITQEMARDRAQDVIDVTTSAFELGLMREMLLEMYQWDRLSSTFRFASGSNTLERKSSLDLDRLIEYLLTQPQGTKVTFVGFTDSDGVFNANRSLSERRSQQVLAEIQSRSAGILDHISFESHGFGELSPAGCNANNDGKRINRRVEVWIQ